MLSNKYRVMALGFALILKRSFQSMSLRYSMHLHYLFGGVSCLPAALLFFIYFFKELSMKTSVVAK